ncbi:uncharacterized protein LOC141641432 [Silene latifolia]|uniref:uncharacterized protein LOC141641432 n=1 Tax=Silene latifolia TaxID=37657 RepID=UPI003D783378
MGLIIDGTCDVCNNVPEDHRHLFYACTYSTACWQQLHQKLHITLPMDNLVNWFSTARVSKLQKRLIGACHVYLFYLIWKVRNEARIKSYVRRPEALVQMVLRDVKARFLRCNTSKMKQRDELWFQQLLWEVINAKEGIELKSGALECRRHEIFARWLAPPANWLALNIDGASKGNPGPAATEGLVRDSSGQILDAFAERLGERR